MKILAVDQARHGAWAIFDYENKELLDYGVWSFDNKKYTFEQAVLNIKALVNEVIHAHNIDAIFLEDIQLRKNPLSFKKLAQLQGVLVNLCEENEFLYDLVAPSQWQNYCNARGRTEREVKAKITAIEGNNKKASKILSLQFVKDLYGINTDNDNLSDSICIGHYVVNNIKIRNEDSTDEKQ